MGGTVSCMQKSTPVVIDVEAFSKAAIRVGLTRTVNGSQTICQSSIARRLGVSQPMISRALKGKPVSAPFIASVLARFPVVYDDVFHPKAA